MSNSALAKIYIPASSNNHWGERKDKIAKIILHHVAGIASAETIANLFVNPSRGASATYCIGNDGKIGRCLDENIVPGTTGGYDIDKDAITIEVSNSLNGGNWPVSDAALSSLIELCADIVKRNSLGTLVKGKNFCWHSMYQATACPGPYLLSKIDYIIEEVNKKCTNETADVIYRVQTGAYSVKANADALAAKLKAKGYDTYIVQSDGMYKVQVGAYSKKENADNMAAKLKADGFDTFITTKSGTVANTTTESESLRVGDKVKLQKDAPCYGESTIFQSWVYDSTLYVRDIAGSKVVISTLKSGAITGAVDKKYLTKI